MNIDSMMGGPSAAMMQQMQQKMFGQMDANKDGGISKSEMTDFAKKNGLDTSRVDEMFKAGDTNGDGKIDQSENSALMDKIGEKMKAAFGQSSTSTGSSTTNTDDVVLKMMDNIRKHSEKSGGTNSLKQFLAHLNQQSTSYDQTGAKGQPNVSSLLTQFA